MSRQSPLRCGRTESLRCIFLTWVLHAYGLVYQGPMLVQFGTPLYTGIETPLICRALRRWGIAIQSMAMLLPVPSAKTDAPAYNAG